MEPHLSAPGPSVEVGMNKGESPKRSEIHFNAPELPARHETKELPLSSTPTPPPTTSSPTLPAPQPVIHSVPQTSLPQSDSPLVAADEDLIEREWVEKAKHIVTETRSDPYQQEKRVSQLQADYIKKRYGKEIKVISEE